MIRYIKRYLNFVAAKSRAKILQKQYLDTYETVLEIGCGDGELARAIRQNVPTIKKYVGCDIRRLLLPDHVLDAYTVLQSPSDLENILEKEKIDVVLIAYVFHHIADDEIIKQYLHICKKYNKKILVVEEIAINPFYKRILCINDLGNICEYRGKINNWKKYFPLNFKSRSAWFSLFSCVGYRSKMLKGMIRKGYIRVEMYELVS